MKYLCFLAYLLINLVNCRFFVTSDYSLQKQVQYTLFFCFYALVFIKLKLRPDVSDTTSGRIFAASGRSKCYIGTHFLLHRNVFYQLTQISRQAEGYIYLFTFIYSVGVMPYSLEKHLEK